MVIYRASFQISKRNSFIIIFAVFVRLVMAMSAMPLVAILRVVHELNPLIEIALSVLCLVVARWSVFIHLFDIFLFYVILHLLLQCLLLVAEFGPHFDSEEVFATCLHSLVLKKVSKEVESAKMFTV